MHNMLHLWELHSQSAANEVLASRAFTPNWEQRSPYLERLSAEVKILSMNPSFLKRSYWLHRDDFMNVLSKIKNHVQTLQYFRMPRAQDFWIRKVHFPELCLTGEQMHFCEKCVFYMHFSLPSKYALFQICTFRRTQNTHFSPVGYMSDCGSYWVNCLGEKSAARFDVFLEF